MLKWRITLYRSSESNGWRNPTIYEFKMGKHSFQEMNKMSEKLVLTGVYSGKELELINYTMVNLSVHFNILAYVICMKYCYLESFYDALKKSQHTLVPK